jgi:hypothetical protein
MNEADAINTSKLYFRCERLWNAMYEAAHPERDPDYFGDADPRMVFTGHVTPLAVSVGENPPYVGQLTRRLRMMGVVRQLARGGGKGIGRWEMVEKPTPELFESTREVVVHTQKARWQLQMEQRVKDLSERVDRLEGHGGE